MGFAGYFLIVWDIIKFARGRGIPVGPGRGSAAGSLVAYALRITDLDPLVYGLLFERFLNPERISLPDIDMDFCMDRRQEVINYVVEKYDKDHVCQIITFGTMKAKAAIRDVGRVMEMPYAEVDRIAKLVPDRLKTLTMIAHAERLIKAKRQDAPLQPFSVADLPLNDPKVFALLSSGRTMGLFQLESAGMRDLLTGLRPDRFEDIIAIIALYRPG